MAKDPVCGMQIEEDDLTTVVKTFLGKKFYFCSVDCLLVFAREPAFFMFAAEQPGKSDASATNTSNEEII